MKHIGVVYLATNKTNGRQYVGQTTWNLKSRLNGHKRSHNSLLGKALCKYGDDNFVVEVLFNAFDIDGMNKAEADLIVDYDTLFPFGYNMMSGGNQSRAHAETRKKLSEAATRRMADPARRAHLSIVQKELQKDGGYVKGRPSPLRGKPLTSEHAKKIGAALKGRPVTEEWRKKISLSKKRFHQQKKAALVASASNVSC